MDQQPAWSPTPEIIANANITHCMQALSITDLNQFHQFTAKEYPNFWQFIITKLGIIFKTPYQAICGPSEDTASPDWLVGAKMNIADSCFTADPHTTAIIYQDEQMKLHKTSYAELEQLSNRVANGLLSHGLKPGDAIAIAMPMNIDAVACYLGIIKIGAAVVSIADSFSSQEFATRLQIANAKAIFTQDYLNWGNKKIPLYNRVCEANAPPCIIIPAGKTSEVDLRQQDMTWNAFLASESSFSSYACDPLTPCNILFSSGTTGTPKAIPWDHTTPIKVASDAFFHQNIQPNDVLAWPTNLGWMMGPWLVFAALINRATIALYAGAPKDRVFGEFIQNTGVTMLGVVPTLVATWRQSKCMEGLDWHQIKVFSSSGECSNSDDMRYLMSLAGGKPVIEYCGGTEIGGAYLSSTVIQDNYAAEFSIPTMGLDILILDEDGNEANIGEVAIIPPSIGLSRTLLNADHEKVYFAGMPTSLKGTKLRRHGDQIERLANGYYAMLGRVDDTMNLGGIKISAAEIERAITGIPDILESAAVCIKPENNGPNTLVIFTVSKSRLNKQFVLAEMQKRINHHLNPLFKIQDIIFIDELPKTASNKIMRRLLRDKIMASPPLLK